MLLSLTFAHHGHAADFLLEAILSHFIIKRIAPDAQRFCGPGDIAVMMAERSPDSFFFQGTQIERSMIFSRNGFGVLTVNIFREMFEQNNVVLGHVDRLLDGILDFANISRPGVGCKCFLCIRVNSVNVLAKSSGYAEKVIFGNGYHVLRSFPQGR